MSGSFGTVYNDGQLLKSDRGQTGATENARPDIARLDTSAPYRKGGHRDTCFTMRVEAQCKLIFAAGSII